MILHRLVKVPYPGKFVFKDIDGFRNVTIEGNLTVEGTTTTIDSTTIEIQNSFVFEGATADGHETT